MVGEVEDKKVGNDGGCGKEKGGNDGKWKDKQETNKL